ncbi:bZIP transcription factor [Aspergillus novofumigatus IBT 16806]|uniref:BZIP domain-containing protein n=1 Tax=Aspergillus novofumigatus (strain IBT 16806) TaxID=1392255 RepID=A0A2I1C3Z0_ASPN1|nr:uncharacterized protein P174DRAFT_431778 [Aspergillus novofumigatus IBT 16806]PKX92354.1 hypothetical protein P174DRAFT_431778 [Aspergillus novofumigatus IBT 16806]
MDASPLEEQSDCRNTPEPSPPIKTSKPPKRGRPRIDRPGETAGERRKQQIRLAQRAYRFRKDLRITELDQEVAKLEQTILAIRDLYLSVHTSVVDSGIGMSHPFLAQSMQTNLQLLLSLTQSVSFSSTYQSTDGSWDETFLRRKRPLPSPPVSSQNPSSDSETLKLPLDSTSTSPGEGSRPSPNQFVLDPLLLCDEYFWEQPGMGMNNDEISLGHLTLQEFSSSHS